VIWSTTEKILVAAAIAGLLLAIAGRRPERRPGNLAPIQLISALGAWALVFANASALAIAIRDGSLVLLSAAVVTLAIALTSFIRDGVTSISRAETPPSMKRVVDEIKELLGDASRLGMNSVEAVVVAGNCPGVGVTVLGQGRVVVRVRQDVVSWLEKHQARGGAGTEVVASFVRFTVLHEIAHVLNGDHRTFRFVRAVLVAHLVWLVVAMAVATSFVVHPAGSVIPLNVSLSIVFPYVAQSLVARRFITERERLADWRAMQTLAPADAARLLERRGRRRAAPNPTELEKLMIDLRAQARSAAGGRLLARLIRGVWPDGDSIRKRAERVGGDPAGGSPQPVRWAALVGMQCGFLAMSLSLAVTLALIPWVEHQRDLTISAMLTIMAWICGPAVTFCEMRVDPARTSVRKPRRGCSQVFVGLVFFLAFIAAALVLYRLQLRFEVASMPSPFSFFAVLMYVAVVVTCCAWAAGPLTAGGGGGGELREMPRSRWVLEYPLYAAFALVLVPLTFAASSRTGGQWLVLIVMSFMSYVLSTMMARSTNPLLRSVAPMAVLDTPTPVYGYRVFWHDFYVDLSQTSVPHAAAIALAVHATAMSFFIAPAAVLMQRLCAVLTAKEALFAGMFIGAIAVMALVLIIPDRYGGYSGPYRRLLDRSRLQLFEKLLAAARIADASVAARLETALSLWLRHERLLEPLLPDPRGIWTLAPLSSLLRIARETGETAVLERWRGRIAQSLEQIVKENAVAVAPGQSPSMYWTTLAATIIDEADLRNSFSFEAMLDRIEIMLDGRLAGGETNLLTDVVWACRLLRRCGRPGPDPEKIRDFTRSASLVSRPLLRQSLSELSELCELADLADGAERREKLTLIVRSRLWEVLQLNPRKDVLLLLDCYLAAVCLDETDPRETAAAVMIKELAQRTSDELMAIVS
jgi:hypothetical protein